MTNKKVVIITGAKGNLGQAAVKKFLDAGHHVVATKSIKDTESFHFIHPELEVFPIDVLDEVMAKNFVDEVAKKHQRIDTALMLVGSYISGKIENTGEEEIDKMIHINFKSAYNVVRPVFKQMSLQIGGGRMILIGSRPAINSEEARTAVAYALSKSLLFKLAETINIEGKNKNVTATVIVPSTIDTPENRAAMPKTDFNKWVKPEEIADAMLHSVGDESKSIRESVIKIYGDS